MYGQDLKAIGSHLLGDEVLKVITGNAKQPTRPKASLAWVSRRTFTRRPVGSHLVAGHRNRHLL